MLTLLTPLTVFEGLVLTRRLLGVEDQRSSRLQEAALYGDFLDEEALYQPVMD